MQRPEFDVVLEFWRALLADRGLPTAVRWVFYEDTCRLPIQNGAWRFMFKLRPASEAERIVRFAYAQSKQELPLALVAYAALDDSTITGLQGDLFTAGDDVYREDWNLYFDARDHVMNACQFAPQESAWRWWWRRVCQPHYLSELDYLVSVKALTREYGHVA